MEQLEFFNIPSPCIGVCTANSNGYCKGCFRSRDERIYWDKLSNIDRRKVARLCVIRRRKALANLNNPNENNKLNNGDLFD